MTPAEAISRAEVLKAHPHMHHSSKLLRAMVLALLDVVTPQRVPQTDAQLSAEWNLPE